MKKPSILYIFYLVIHCVTGKPNSSLRGVEEFLNMIYCWPIKSPTSVSKTIVGQKPEEQKKNVIF